MTKTRVLILCVLTMTVASWALAEEREPKVQAPNRVMIVLEGVLHSRDGISQTKAISIVNDKTIKKLEAFFPNYRSYPSSEDAAGWDSGYSVYFNFRKGRTIRLAVSHPQNGGDLWSAGDGDFKTRGDFPAFVKDLQRRAGR
ncbi:MAG: hypothetical protein NXI22_09330 [bacterium]|nr:hypothetical protein [bacterium]